MISKNLSLVKKELKNAQLVAVSKYSPFEDIVLAYHANQFDFGENKVQELIDKAEAANAQGLSKIRWHFIGHLQTNKVKELLRVPHLFAIHSVDSIRLLEELMKRESDIAANELKLFFQVNTSHELEKSGFVSPEELKQAIDLLMNKPLTKLKFFGLMTMGTIRTTNFEIEASRCFRDLALIARSLETSYQLKDKLKLSMGMSQDYKLAIDAGSDYVRIGSAIFKA